MEERGETHTYSYHREVNWLSQFLEEAHCVWRVSVFIWRKRILSRCRKNLVSSQIRGWNKRIWKTTLLQPKEEALWVFWSPKWTISPSLYPGEMGGTRSGWRSGWGKREMEGGRERCWSQEHRCHKGVRVEGAVDDSLNRCWKSIWQNTASILNKSPQQSRFRGNIPEHNKGRVWKTHNKHHTQWGKSERCPPWGQE